MPPKYPQTTPSSAEKQGTKPLELLAPAGDRESLEAAILAGADAVYGGLTTLNARRRAKNFEPDELAEVVRFVHGEATSTDESAKTHAENDQTKPHITNVATATVTRETDAAEPTARHPAKFYLTLNIDLAEREIGQAVRSLELAQRAGVDAVLVRDPALMHMIPHFPKLDFHFSTQTCIANSADVQAAKLLGAKRVVLAREMTLKEIAVASAVSGIETEVFCQGALCFSISGRCMMSSWAGGRSGNRGTCTSPCRVAWNVGGKPAGTPMSMHDLATIRRISELEQTGVAALKIEGRLKKSNWVAAAVQLYRRALSGEAPKKVYQDAGPLGAYTGRAFTWGYLDGDRIHLTGLSAGRLPTDDDELSQENCGCQGGVPNEDTVDEIRSDTTDAESNCDAAADFDAANDETRDGSMADDVVNSQDADAEGTLENAVQAASAYAMRFDLTGPKLRCECRCGTRNETWNFPKSIIRRAAKAVTLEEVLNYLRVTPVQGLPMVEASTSDPEFMIAPRTMNNLIDRITKTIQLAKKPVDDRLRLELSDAVQQELAKRESSAENQNRLGTPPDRVRIEATRAVEVVRNVGPTAAILEGITPKLFHNAVAVSRLTEAIVALPSVFFEDEVPEIRTLCQLCAEQRIAVEVNSWGGWFLAKEAGAIMEAGPGLPVLNSLAAIELEKLGCRNVTISIEADRGQIELLTRNCPVPCSMVVFSRPPLATTRVRLPDGMLKRIFVDRGDLQMIPKMEHGLTVFRTAQPMDLRDLTNPRILATHYVVDLVGSPEPLEDYYPSEEDTQSRRRGKQEKKRTYRFNYFRELQ